MSLFYLVRKKTSVLNGIRKTLWYAVAKKFNGKSEKDIARRINQRGAFHYGVVLGVLEEVAITLEDMLADGHPVTIKGIGTFQTSVTSDGFENPEDVKPHTVRISRIHFTADRELSRRVKEADIEQIPLERYFKEE